MPPRLHCVEGTLHSLGSWQRLVVVQFEFRQLPFSKGVILSAAASQAERRMLRVTGQGFGDAPREIPHPAEERRFRNNAFDKSSKYPNCTTTQRLPDCDPVSSSCGGGPLVVPRIRRLCCSVCPGLAYSIVHLGYNRDIAGCATARDGDKKIGAESSDPNRHSQPRLPGSVVGEESMRHTPLPHKITKVSAPR